MGGYLTKSDVATMLDITIPTVDRYMKKGLPYYKLNGYLVRFKEEEVREWIEKRGE